MNLINLSLDLWLNLLNFNYFNWTFIFSFNNRLYNIVRFLSFADRK